MLMAIMAEKRVEMMTGGAIGALVIGLVAPLMWEKGWPRGLSQGHRQHYAHALEHTTATVRWDVLFTHTWANTNSQQHSTTLHGSWEQCPTLGTCHQLYSCTLVSCVCFLGD